MSGLAFAVTLLIEILCGAVGGVAVGRAWSHLRGRTASNAISGGVGGLIFTWLAAWIPGVGRFVGYVENAADSAMHGTGGVRPEVLVGAGIAGLLGGMALTAMSGLLRNKSLG